jgi:(S)-2-hydroxyglutarate dehydrogenase
VSSRRVAVVGGGIIGVAVARRVLQVDPDATVTVYEKERALAQHQTGHNSGVVHAGLYYAPGSLKAELCSRGRSMLASFCAEQHLPYDECGKVVVALDGELAGLDEIERRARANGVVGLRRLSAGELREVEPHVTGVAALHSPHTAIADFAAVTRALADDARRSGAVVRLGTAVTAVRHHGDEVLVGTPAGWDAADRVVACAGLQVDRVAALAGDDPDPRIVPFRGEYYLLRPERKELVRGLVYPVPDPRYPFLGVHLTRRIDGEVMVGPNAVLALAREGYGWSNLAPRDLWATLAWPGFRTFARRHWRTGVVEMRGSLSRRAFVAAARRYVPELSADDVVRGPSGVRAQALGRDGSLVDDFRLTRTGRVVSVRNAPSPAATSSLAIAERIVAMALAD